jgi:peptidyl-prolyl cis-trans isomerase SurA
MVIPRPHQCKQTRVMPIVPLLLGMLLAYPYAPALGQGVQRIAAIVNDDVVSIFDLQTRMRVVIASSGIRPSRRTQQRLKQQVLRTLIDERLQLQEAKKRNVLISKRNVQEAMANLEKQNNIKPGKFSSFLREKGLPKSAVFARIRAQIAWTKLVRRRLVSRVTISDDEISEVLTRLKERKGQTEYRVSELFLPVDNADQESIIRKTAQRLADELRVGARFSAVARQFSTAASASTGGDLGWIQESVLNEDLASVVPKMKPGTVAGPVRTISGFQIYRLAAKRKILEPSADEAIVDLRRIKLPLPDKSSREEIQVQANLAKLLSETVAGCDDMVPMAKQADATGRVLLGKMQVGKLGEPLRGIVRGLKLGKASAPVRTPSGISIFMVCDKKFPKSNLPTPARIKERLTQERLSVLIRRYMRDLRSAAVIDVRV